MPRYPALTREDYEGWSKIWPIHYKRPPPAPATEVPADLLESYSQYMTRALQLLAEHRVQAGCRCRNACLVVDPGSGRVVGQGVDETHLHPLRHAAISVRVGVGLGGGC